MKKIFLFSTKPLFYTVLIPPIFLLIIAINYNSSVKTLMKLYPLIVLCSAVILFTLIFFFRGVTLSIDEVKQIGLFSERSRIDIKAKRTLVLTKLGRGKLQIELYGSNTEGDTSYAWLKNEEPTEINLFRARALGSDGSIKRILRSYAIPSDAITEAIENDEYSASYRHARISTAISDPEGQKQYKIYFNETIIEKPDSEKIKL